MRRPPAVPPQPLQKLADRPVVGDRVADRLDASEPEAALVVRDHDAALAGAVLVAVLHVVVAARVRLPNVHLDAGQRVPIAVLDGADGQHRLALGVRRHALPVGQRRGVVRVEGTQDRTLGAARRRRVVDVVDQQRQPEHVRQQDELVALVVRDLARRDQKLDGRHPLLRRQPRLPRKVVQVRHQPLHDVAEARRWRLRVYHVCVLRDVVDGEVEELRRR